MSAAQAERLVAAVEAIACALVVQTARMDSLIDFQRWTRAQNEDWVAHRKMLAVERAHSEALALEKMRERLA